MRKFLVALVLIVVTVGAAFAYFSREPNRFKPDLEALIADQTGAQVKINGDLDWRLFPPLLLTANDVSAEHDGRSWQVANLALDMDVLSLLGGANQWEVQALTLESVIMTEGEERLEVSQFRLADFSPGEPAPMAATLAYGTEESGPIPLTLTALVTYEQQPERYLLQDARFSTDNADGVCDATAMPSSTTLPTHPAGADDIVPIWLFRDFDWQGSCAIAELSYNGETFADATLNFENTGGISKNLLTVPSFLSGTAAAELTIDATARILDWTLTPDLDGVDSQKLMIWLGQELQWLAPLAYGGTLTMSGNNKPAMLTSLSGDTQFDGGEGEINIAKIKEQLLKIAVLLNEADEVLALPDMYPYQRMVGNWRIDNQNHELDFALDNLTVLAEGDYDPIGDVLDLKAELVFENDPDLPSFDVNPLLVGLPIPVRCRGALADPECRVSNRDARRVVAQALGNEDSPLHAKIDEKIEEHVPEEYQDAAKALLDILSGTEESEPE